MIRNILILSVLGAALYVVLMPVPADIEIPWKLKLITVLFKAVFRLKTFVEPFVPSRLAKVLDEGSRESQRSLGPNVTYTDTTFDGVAVQYLPTNRRVRMRGARQSCSITVGDGGLVALVPVGPEYLFPAAIDDCTTATVSFLQRLQDFNVDPTRVAVMGDSAGGNLAAAVAQRLTFDPQYKELPTLKMQVLIYPCLQAFDFQTPSYQQNGDYSTVIVDRLIMAEFWAVYLNNNPSLKTQMSRNEHTTTQAKASPLIRKCLSHDLIPEEFKQKGYTAPPAIVGDEALYDELREGLLNPNFAPLMRDDLKGLPEAYILTAEYDVLRDDGIMYAKRLEAAGVKVTWNHYKKGFHAMFCARNGIFASPSEMHP